jgi:hypothetical protein
MKKILVFGIIALFIGLAFIPSFNAVSISKDNEETNPLVDDIEEDCGCKIIDRIQLVRLKRISILLDILSNKLEEFSDIIPLPYKHNKEIEEKYIDISEKISTLQEINKELKLKLSLGENDDNYYICGILLLMLGSMAGIVVFLEILFEKYPILYPILYPIIIITLLPTFVVVWVGIMHYNCIDPPPY